MCVREREGKRGIRNLSTNILTFTKTFRGSSHCFKFLNRDHIMNKLSMDGSFSSTAAARE